VLISFRRRCSAALVVLCVFALPAQAGAPVAAPPPAAPKAKVPANTEDCVVVEPLTVKADNAEGTWKVVLGPTASLDYGQDAGAAKRAVEIIQHYHFTRQCFVRRTNVSMMYWRNGVAVPPGNIAGQDCIAFHPGSAQAIFSAGRWKVLDGNIDLLDYGLDSVGAETAAKIIQTYNLNRQCFVARPHVAMQYWLAE
jgi:hypothetical protein